MNTTQYKNILEEYTTKKIASYIADVVAKGSFQFKIAAHRVSKLGDFSPKQGNRNYHRISVNGSLNPYAFFITFIHELAHLKVWDKYQNKVKSHGDEWKNEYAKLLIPLINKNYFPSDISSALISHVNNIKSATQYDTVLSQTLDKYNENPASEDDESIYITNLKIGDVFVFRGRKFCIKEQKRKLIYCETIPKSRIYAFNPIAKVKPINIKNEIR
ncbi:MAG: hypothetical protein ACOXZK_01330 [Bacteroidales bacterium]|jgi:hypothetical protein|nr:hypothetical protein [Bacteroidales bacterium]